MHTCPCNLLENSQQGACEGESEALDVQHILAYQEMGMIPSSTSAQTRTVVNS